MVTRLAVHFADEYKVECDKSFHARLHTRVLSAERFFLLHHTMYYSSAKVQWEYRSLGVLVLVVDAR